MKAWIASLWRTSVSKEIFRFHPIAMAATDSTTSTISGSQRRRVRSRWRRIGGQFGHHRSKRALTRPVRLAVCAASRLTEDLSDLYT